VTAGAIRSLPADTRNITGATRRMVEDDISTPRTAGANLRMPSGFMGILKACLGMRVLEA